MSIRISGDAGENSSGHRRATFAASGRTITFPGFLKAYVEAADETAESSDKRMADDAERRLPQLTEGQQLTGSELVADGHSTSPPARYTEASLVKALEERGIGRPSTYASTISVITDRGYVLRRGQALVPSWLAFSVVRLLEAHFERLVDYDFTAKLEDELDAVSRGEQDWVPLMEQFWGPFKELVDDKIESVDRSQATGARELGTDPKTGKPVSVRLGRYGPYAAIGSTAEDAEEKPKFASLRPGQSMHTITLEEALELFLLPRVLGEDKGEEVSAGIGRFGPFVKRGTTYASLKKEDDPHTVTLERAVELIEEKEEIARNRIIKEFEGSDIQVLNGRYGPYISDGRLNGKIPKDREPASLTLEEVTRLLEETSKPARRGFGKKAAKKVARKVAKKATKKAAKKVAKKAAGKVAKKTAKKATKKAAAKRASSRPLSGDREEARPLATPAEVVPGRKRVVKKSAPDDAPW